MVCSHIEGGFGEAPAAVKSKSVGARATGGEDLVLETGEDATFAVFLEDFSESAFLPLREPGPSSTLEPPPCAAGAGAWSC